MTPIVLPELHEQFIRQSKLTLVNERIKLGPYASRLAFRFMDTMTPFIKENLVLPDEQCITKWNRCLPGIFEGALRLTLQASLLEDSIEYVWPRIHERFDPKTMKSTDLVAPRGERIVQAVFFPSVHREAAMKSQDEGGRRPILRALVQVV